MFNIGAFKWVVSENYILSELRPRFSLNLSELCTHYIYFSFRTVIYTNNMIKYIHIWYYKLFFFKFKNDLKIGF